MKINLIFLCANFEKGGAGNSIIRLCQKLNRKKYIISIICLNKFSYLDEIKNTNIKIFKIHKNKIIFSIFVIKKIILNIMNKNIKNILVSNINYTNVISVLFLRKINLFSWSREPLSAHPIISDEPSPPYARDYPKDPN